ncbi:MAG: ribonuclease D [Gammaproteobacteria bacterium]|nr:ribonuclease D [Gammaproteobacteria bacterium]
MPTPAHGRLLDRQDALDAASALMNGPPALPIDTEFARTDTYRPKLCLVQVAVPGQVFCADMLAPLDFGSLWNGLAAPGVTKIMHAAKQDLEVLLLSFGSLPAPLFDTQIAAGLLGFPPQAGYATLVAAELGVQLDKSQTRTDWSRRPLTSAQIDYAANDVAHLGELALRLRERLVARGRESWALEDCAALLDPALYGVRAERAWERLPGVAWQSSVVQARARRLAAWRERRADQANRPRQWILADQALMALAGSGPADVAGIETLDVMPRAAVRHSAPAILAELRQAEADLASGALQITPGEPPATTDNGRLRKLGTLVQKLAGELGIAAEILATRADLVALLRGASDVRPLRGWRRDVVGERLLAAL